jgi:hypothetical protein
MTFVVISAPVFSTRTPAQLLEFLKVRAPGPDGKARAGGVGQRVGVHRPVIDAREARRHRPGVEPRRLTVSAPVFSTRTPAQLLEFLKVRAPGPDGKPDAEKIV